MFLDFDPKIYTGKKNEKTIPKFPELKHSLNLKQNQIDLLILLIWIDKVLKTDFFNRLYRTSTYYFYFMLITL